MKRSGFTMIELIFVIVILGILAAVAIPRLAATRDDAKISKGSSDVATLVSDLGAYYTANGDFNSTGTNVALDANLSDTTLTANYELPVGTDCVTVTTTTDGNLTLTASASNTDTVCVGVVSAVTANGLIGKTHVFGGKRITY